MFTVDPKTVTRWANAGLIPVVRTPGGRRRYPEAEVLKFFESLTRQDGEVEQ
jgi:predicted site-specific integrase-resolvase